MVDPGHSRRVSGEWVSPLRQPRVAANARLAQRHWRLEWADVVRDFDRVQETRLQVNQAAYVVRSPATGVAGKIFQACGVALPPVVRPC